MSSTPMTGDFAYWEENNFFWTSNIVFRFSSILAVNDLDHWKFVVGIFVFASCLFCMAFFRFQLNDPTNCCVSLFFYSYQFLLDGGGGDGGIVADIFSFRQNVCAFGVDQNYFIKNRPFFFFLLL